MINYALRCIRYMDFGSFVETIKQIKKESKKNALWILMDIIYCGFRYGAGFNDYKLCKFYRLSSAERKTYITRGKNNMLASKLTNASYKICFEDKQIFYRLFNQFLHREWLIISHSTKREVIDFLEKHKAVIVKPAIGSGGKGIEKIYRADFLAAEDMLRHIESLKVDLIEECIAQHEIMAKMNPHSVNTIRIVTVLHDGEVNFMYAYMRMGTGHSVVDNLHSGGIFAPVDLLTGRITHEGYSKNQITYLRHPQSGQRIKDFEIPSWEKAKSLCETAAKELPEMQYIGWDVAINQNSEPVLVEGNHLPGYDFLQMPVHMDNKTGMLPSFYPFIAKKKIVKKRSHLQDSSLKEKYLAG